MDKTIAACKSGIRLLKAILKKPALLLLMALGLVACSSWPGLEDPQLTGGAYVALFRMTGDTRMQSRDPGTGAIRNNYSISVEQFGAGRRDEELGFVMALGDGFSGFKLDYLLLDMRTTVEGTLPTDWGALAAGDVVIAKTVMEEGRLAYIAKLFDYQNEDEYWLKFGLGLQLAHREISYDVINQNNTAQAQKLEIKDQLLPYLATRIGFGRGPLKVITDFAYNEDVGFGAGDFEDILLDLEIKASYYFEDQDLTVFGGYRRFTLPASGGDGPLRWDVDFRLDGYIFGLEISF